jgi:FKBP12-rapamycin complex-associated protein
MLDRASGKIIHIDFGDCFEVAMHRDKFPEKVPFRLTRMLVRAMEVSGIEGTFMLTCERVMRMMRNNKESVMAVLEAFIYDPLVTWRLLSAQEREAQETEAAHADDDEDGASDAGEPAQEDSPPAPASPAPAASPREAAALSTLLQELDLYRVADGAEQASALLNAKALSVIARVDAKLIGRDLDPAYGPNKPPSDGEPLVVETSVRGFQLAGEAAPEDPGDEGLDVPEQVARLVTEATSTMNLCQCYIGWCGFW